MKKGIQKQCAFFQEVSSELNIDIKEQFDSSEVHCDGYGYKLCLNDSMHEELDFSGRPTDFIKNQKRKNHEVELDSIDFLEEFDEKDPVLLKFQQCGFSIQNQSAFYIELMNSLNCQIKMLQKVIFTKSKSYIYAYDINFGDNQPLDKNKSIQSRLQQIKIDNLLQLQWAQVTSGQKLNFLQTRKKLEKLKKKIEQFLSLRTDHTCIYCGEVFAQGRQLGGHMSRKHPGSSLNNLKVKKNKQRQLENKRRKYFSSINKSITVKRRQSRQNQQSESQQQK